MALIGREEEVRALERAVGCAAAKEGGVLVLSGEPGIGKTSLLREMELSAESRRFNALYVRSTPRHLPDKELLWQRVWRGLAETASSNGMAAACAGSSHYTGADCRKMVAPGAAAACDGQSAAALFRAILESLIGLARNSPLLVAIDDIHYADEYSLKLLSFLSQSLDGLPVLLALALSPCMRAGGKGPDLMAELLAGRGRGLEVGPLDEEATAQILCKVIGFAPHQSIVRSVHQLAGGNPRFVSECASVVTDLGVACPGKADRFEIRIPTAVRVALGERLKALSPEAERVLKFGTVFLNGFEPELISEVADLDEAEAHAAISELRNAGLIRLTNGQTYDYTHGFTRELLYRELSVARRSHLHRRIASALEINDAPEISGKARQIAEHLMRSGKPETIERAIRHARFAAQRFAGLRDFATAAQMYALVVEGIESQPSPDHGELCEMLIALGEAQREAREIESAQRSFCRAARLAQDLADNQKLVRIVLAMPDFGWPFADSPNGAALMLAQKAIAAMPEEGGIERALLTARVAGEYSYMVDQRRRSEALFAEAVEMAHRAGSDEDTMLPILVSRDKILRYPELLEDRLANAEQIIQITYKTGDGDALFAAAFAKYCVLCETGGAASAHTQIALMQQAANLADRPEYQVVLIGLQAARALHRGRLDLAEQFCNEALRTANVNGLDSLADRFWPCLAAPLRENGRLGELAPVAENLCREQLASYDARALLCWLVYELGDTAQARSQLELLATETFGDLRRGPYSTAAAALLAEVAAGLKMSRCAALLYDFLLPFKNRYVIVEPSCTPFGCVSRYLGKLAMALSNCGQALAHFEEAVQADRKIGGRTWTAYSLVELAKSLLIRGGPGDRERAAEILGEARTEAASLQMHLLEKDISRLADGAGDNSTQSAPDSVGAAFEREPPPQAAKSSSVIAAQAGALLRREAGSWRLTFDGRTVHVKELRGLTLIAHLVSRPNQPVNVLELAVLGKNGEVISDRAPISDLGPVLDEDAKKAYRERVQQLDLDLEEARSSGNEQAALKIEEELCFITREIARAVGLFGRDRRAGSEAERARVRVTNSIKFAIGKIAEDHPALGAYLQKTIRTGANCSYLTESTHAAWDLEGN
jgi:tetratricopeptide (TPR) repeat protein